MIGSMKAGAFLAIATLAAAQDPAELLARVRTKVAADAERIPRYICRQRIVRKTSFAESNKTEGCAEVRDVKPRLSSIDRARLDVILVDGGELFSWPGKHRFEANTPADLLAAGLSGSGDFAGFRIDIFRLNDVFIRYEGGCGEDCARFVYDVPRPVSRYVMRVTLGDIRIGYHGTFDANTRTGEITKLVVMATDAPSILHGACELRTQMTYSRAGSDRGDFMIPAITEKYLQRSDGAVFENRLDYDECHQYSAESTLRFEEDADEGKLPASRVSSTAALSAGTILEAKMVTPIDSDKNFAGDPIEARLSRAVRDNSGRVIRAGTILRGHLSQVEERVWPRKEVVFAIRLDAMVIGGVELPIDLRRIGLNDERGRGLFVFPSNHAILDERTVMRWQVLAH